MTGSIDRRAHRLRDVILVLATFAGTCWLLERDPLGETFAAPLEHRFAGVKAEGEFEGIIALGGAHARMMEGYRLARVYPKARLIISVISDPHTTELIESNADVRARTLFDAVSTTTRENALEAVKLAQPKPSERWLLVTSGPHMPRAIGVFRKVGFDVTPWPITTDDRRSRLSWRVALHELFGLLVYRWRGWTDALFPGPA